MFTLPELPFEYDALEPYISQRIMELHHGKHHAGYTKKVNALIEGTDFENKTIEDILSDPSQLPDTIRQGVCNNGGGYYNHKLFWESLSPESKNGGGLPGGSLSEKIVSQFGSFDAFKKLFTEKSMGLFGSGRVYLCKDGDALVIKRHSFQETPLKHGLIPLLGLDVREHAYYLQYENRRAEYVDGWWNIINRSEVEKRFIA